jgi:hypothetical protein
MKKLLISAIVLLVIASLMLGGCGGATETITVASPTTTTTTTTSTTTTTTTSMVTQTITPTETPIRTVVIFDDTDDLFDTNGVATTGEDYLDIVKAEALSYRTHYILRMTLNGNVPTQTTEYIEWNVYADLDMNPNTGMDWPEICNNIGPDIVFSLSLLGSNFFAELYYIADAFSTPIEYEIKGNVIDLRVPKIPEQDDTGYYVFAVLKYGDIGDPNSLLVADKAPDTGYGFWEIE